MCVEEDERVDDDTVKGIVVDDKCKEEMVYVADFESEWDE